MKKKEFSASEVLNTSKIKGHFSLVKYDIGNGKFGVDIFTFYLKKEGRDYVVKMGGIYRKGIIELLEQMGIYYKEVRKEFLKIRKQGNIITEVSLKEIKDLMNEYLNQLPPLEIEIDGASEVFTKEAQIELVLRQINLVFNEQFLQSIKGEDTPIITDTKDKVVLFFDNGILEVEKSGVNLLDYSSFRNGLIWKDNIIDFKLDEKDAGNSAFSDFINNVCNNDISRILALRSAIGYLLHSFHRKSGGQIVLLYDEAITGLNIPQGGNGKGLVANAVSIIREMVKIDGKKFKGDDKFGFQEVKVTSRVLLLDDVGKQFDIDRLNSVATNGFNVEKKFKSSFMIPSEESPKILISSNIILDSTGTTRKRRQFIIELSDYYSSKIIKGNEEPIVAEHGGRFFTDDWDKKEWNRFYWFMIDWAQLYLDKGLINAPTKNVVENRLRQTLGEDFYNWINEMDFKVGETYNTKDKFYEYKTFYEEDNEKFSQRSFSNMLTNYFSHEDKSIEFFSESQKGKKVSYFRIRN